MIGRKDELRSLEKAMEAKESQFVAVYGRRRVGKMALGISGVLTEVFAWRHDADDTYPWGAQIDLLLERADNVINVCEVKYAKGEFVIKANYAQELDRKCETFSAVTGTKSAVHLTMVTTEGVARNSYSDIVQSEVTLDDLFCI